MARKSIIEPFKALDNIDMSVTTVQPAKPGQAGGFTAVKTQDNMAYHVKWAGTAPVGEILVEVTNDDLDNPNNIPLATWTELDFGTPIPVSGATGSHLLNINQNPGAYMRISYVATSGTGFLTATLVSKALGGA